MYKRQEVRVDAVKRNMGIAYVIKKSVKRELEAKELYEVELPIKLPSVKLNLIYLKGELSKVSKSFIKNYLRNKKQTVKSNMFNCLLNDNLLLEVIRNIAIS